MHFAPRWSLKLFFLVITISGAAVGVGGRWYFHVRALQETERAHQAETETLRELHQRDNVFEVHYDDEGFVESIGLRWSLTPDEWKVMPRFRRLAKVYTVPVYSSVVDGTDSRMPAKIISQLTRLSSLDLRGVEITPDAMTALARLPSLERLMLRKCHFDLATLAELKRVESLKTLYLELDEVQLAQLSQFDPVAEFSGVATTVKYYDPLDYIHFSLTACRAQNNLLAEFERHPADRELIARAASVFAFRKNTPMALKLSQQVLNEPLATPEQRATAFRIRGLDLLEKGNHPGAAREFQQFIAAGKLGPID